MSSGQNDSGNPAWNEILAAIPPEFHNKVKPKLQAWDQTVNQKFQEIHAQYEPYKGYKNLVDHGIDPEYANNAVLLADQLQRDPNVVVNHVNETYGLGYLSKQEAEALQQQAAVAQSGQNGAGDTSLDDFLDDSDIMRNPKVKALADSLTSIQQEINETKAQQEERENEEAWEDYLDDLEEACAEDNLPFNRVFVDAMLQQGMTGEAAIEQYHQILGTQVVAAQQAANQSNQQPPQTNQAPPIMGTAGNVGAGVSDGTVDFAGMKKSALNDAVEQLLAQSAQSGQG